MPAFGAFTHPPLSKTFIGAGISTELGTWLPAGEVVAYVHSSGPQDGIHEDVNARLYTDINSALALCRASQNDIVVVLPGHAENVASADDWSNLVAGTTIVGMGSGNLRPTFTWSTATSTVLLNVANVTISNCIFEFAGDPDLTAALTVAAPITVSAAGCTIQGCRINFGIDADQLCTIGITTTAAADDFSFLHNHCHGATAAECTTFMDIIGCDRLRMEGNYIQGGTSSVSVGIVRFATTASLDIVLVNNYYGNLKAASTCAVTGLAGVSGVSKFEHFHYLDNASDTPWLTSNGLMAFHEAYITNLAGEVGLIATPVSV